MPRVNVYLPEELAARAKQADLNLSALTQDAVRRALGARETNTWLATLEERSGFAVSHEAALAALDSARDEAVTRHG